MTYNITKTDEGFHAVITDGNFSTGNTCRSKAAATRWVNEELVIMAAAKFGHYMTLDYAVTAPSLRVQRAAWLANEKAFLADLRDSDMAPGA